MADRIFKGECGIEGCDKPIEAAGMCAGHRSRKKKKRTVSGAIRSYSKTPFESISAAALAYADTAAESTDEEFKLARERFRSALDYYFKRARSTKG